MIFEEEYFCCYILLSDQVSMCGLPLLHEMLSIKYIVIVCEAGCDIKNFEINLIFLIKPFLLYDQNVKTKI